MPFEEHPEIVTPPDTTTLWRYLDFARFVELIDSGTLWFARLDQLEDPLEAMFTDAELDHFRSQPPPPGRSGESMLEAFIGMNTFMKKSSYVNCWRAGDSESLAMWDLYGRGSGVLAVKTTMGLLKNALSATDAQVFIGQVRYVDWGTAPWHNNAVAMCARKDMSYAHESEVRAMIWEASCVAKSSIFERTCPGRKSMDTRTKEDPPQGVRIAIDLSTTITEVVVGPREKPWIRPLVQDVLKKYGFSFPIKASDRLTPR